MKGDRKENTIIVYIVTKEWDVIIFISCDVFKYYILNAFLGITTNDKKKIVSYKTVIM